MKRIDVEPDFEVWKEYAYKNGVHPSIITYLEIKTQNFYKIENTVDGRKFVTARGWDDLSRIIKQYEKHNIKINKNVVNQYLQNEKIAGDFALYYDLYNKYKSDYQINDIVEGKADSSIVERAKRAEFDERYALLGLLLDVLGRDAKNVIIKERLLINIKKNLKQLKTDIEEKSAEDVLRSYISELERSNNILKDSNSLSQEQSDLFVMQKKALESYIEKANVSKDAFKAIKAAYKKDVSDYSAECKEAEKHFVNVFGYCDNAFGKNGQELLILVTEISMNNYCAEYVSRKGCKEYYEHDGELMFYERNLEIIHDIEKLDSDIFDI